ncbi:alpha/beta fold hydrolase [Natrialbaceae archaeon A-CW1-1]
MRHRLFNEDGETDLVFVMGLGNRWTHENVSWLIGTLADAGYRVHAFEIPTNIDDFKADWLEPVAEYVIDLEEYQLLAHSAGSLIAQALDGAENHVYLSPWWGYNEDYPDVVIDLAAQIPTSAPFLPRGEVSKATIGDLATDHQLATSPKWVSPSFLRETRRAQADLLDIDHDAVVFCSLQDTVIDLRPIGERVPPEHVVLYDGGHELFSSSVRDQYVDLLLAALEAGADAIESKHVVPTETPGSAEAAELEAE